MRFLWYAFGAILFGVLWTSCAVAAKDECKHQPKKVPEGRNCRKRCINDKDCKSEKKTCNCDNVCGKTCFNPKAECDPIDEIANGWVKASNTIYDAVAVYECENGFELRGIKERKCQSDRKWSGKAPECIERACEFPPRVDSAFADIDQSHFKEGDVVTYKCRHGFSASGNANITCQSDHTWSPARFFCVKVSCGKPETPLHGFVEGEDFKFGGRVTYRCDKGYEIAQPNTARRYCSTTGRWSGTLSVCQIKSCPPPTAPIHGDAEYSSLNFGSVVKYSCNQGYLLRGNKEGLCDDKESWGDTPACDVDINCKFQTADRPLCGYKNKGSGLWERQFHENSRYNLPTYAVTFRGEKGTAILRSPTIPDGKPHCVKFYYFTEGELAASDLFIKLNGKNVKKLAPDGAEIPKRRWVGFQASLAPTKDEIVIEIVFEGNAQIWIDDLQVDKGQCESECELSNRCENEGICVDEIRSFYCSCTQFYTGKTCDTEITCKLLELNFGSVRPPNRLIYGSHLTFLCDKGYERRGPSFVTCTKDGWSTQPPKCVEIVNYDGECPRNFIPHQLMCYRYYKDKKTYHDAHETCQTQGAKLATVQSMRVDNFLFDEAPSWPLNYYFWVGLRSKNFQQSWESGFAYEGGEKVDFDLTNAGNDNCGAYHFVAKVHRSSLWQIGFHDCRSRKMFICEVWKKTAAAYVLDVDDRNLHDIRGVYEPVAGLVTESGRQVYRKDDASKLYTYLYHGMHPDTGRRRWYIGDYSIRFARPGYWRTRAASDALYPDRIESDWINRSILPVRISLSKNDQWGSWTIWACDTICGEGISERRRTCKDGIPGSIHCRGSDLEQKACDNDPCPVTHSKYETKHGGISYQFMLQRVSWWQARQRCRDKQMRLAVSTSKDVQDVLIKKIKEIAIQDHILVSYWINGHKPIGEAWQFSDTTRIDVKSWMWAPGEPNAVKTAKMDCIELSKNGWNDHSCETETPFICEKALSSNQCELNLCPSSRICRVLKNGYSCDCPEGTIEPNCAVPETSSDGEKDKVSGPCFTDRCNSGGKCVKSNSEVDGFLCYCSPERKGKYCENDRDTPEMFTEISVSRIPTSTIVFASATSRPLSSRRPGSSSGDICATDRCNGGGKCSESDSDPEGFVCFCKTGNLGKHCEIRNACRLNGIIGDVKIYKDDRELGRGNAVSQGEELFLKCSNSEDVILGVNKITCNGVDQWSRSAKILCMSSGSACVMDEVDPMFKVFREDDEEIKTFPIGILSGAFLRFKCEGNNGQEAFIIDCKAGKWQSSPPTRCVSAICPDIEAPANGAMTVSPTSAVKPYGPNVEVSFTCNKFFLMKGSSDIVCQEDGTWSNSVPKCEESGCLLFYFELNTNVYVKDHSGEDIEADSGDIYVLKCKDNDEDKATITCMGKLVWKPTIDTITCP